MKKGFGIITGCILFFCCFCLNASAGSHQQIGVGAHYWTTVDDIDIGNIDESGMSWYISYSNRMSALLQVEVDLEIADKDHAGNGETVFAPQAFLLLGATLYGGVGIGADWADSEFGDPYYMLRAGYNIELLPKIFVDFNANYRFETWNTDTIKEDIDADTLTLGAFVRVGF